MHRKHIVVHRLVQPIFSAAIVLAVSATPLLGQTGASTKLPPALLIRGGQVIDGTGSAARKADVRVSGGVITEIAPNLTSHPGERVIDATNLTVTPGFIDLHSHADRGIQRMLSAESQVRQGITTAVVGQDGGSELPVSDFLEEMDHLHPAINFVSMIGHGSVRAAVMGGDFHRAATPAEITAMKVLVDRGMRDGAVGLSSGTEYDPGFFSTPEEVQALARVVVPYGGYYASHVRDEENGVLAAWNEVLDVGRKTGVRVHISHAKLASKPVWGKAAEGLALLDNAAHAGVKVTADWYPYTYWSSSMYVLIPDRNFDNRKEWEVGLDEIGGPDNVLVTDYEPDSTYNGKTVTEIAQSIGKDPITTIIGMLHAAGPNIGVIVTAMQEKDLDKLVADPRVSICSDGGLAGAHPRGYGTFPRVLGVYVREKGILTLPQAVAKMTSHTAQILGFSDRGTLAAGKKADIVLIDPATVVDRGTKLKPAQNPVGIPYVIVNGEVVLDNGEMTASRPGLALRRQNWKPYAAATIH
jgi:N-acyl-D-amino-acid deacylase